jgi:putative transposase
LEAVAKTKRQSQSGEIKVARIHERIANFRHNFINTLSHRLVQEYDVIVVEALALKGMAQGLGKSVMVFGYSDFVSKLQYKALWNDKTVILMVCEQQDVYAAVRRKILRYKSGYGNVRTVIR